jgi:hypothetical protein
MPLGLGVGDIVRFVREAREGGPWAGPLLVIGPLAEQLARSLAAGGDPAAVRTSGRPPRASAVVCVLAGAPRDNELDLLRAATRAAVPAVGVQTGDSGTRIPYVPAGDIVDCRPGQGFPVDEIARAVARVLGRDAAGLAARLPILRPAVQRHLVSASAIRAAVIAAAPWVHEAHLPVLVLLQARLLRDVAAAGGHPAPQTPQQVGLMLGPELGGALATGIAGKGLSRTVPWAGAVGRAAIASVGTAFLGTVAATQGDRLARLAQAAR